MGIFGTKLAFGYVALLNTLEVDVFYSDSDDHETYVTSASPVQRMRFCRLGD